MTGMCGNSGVRQGRTSHGAGVKAALCLSAIVNYMLMADVIIINCYYADTNWHVWPHSIVRDLL